MQAVSGKNPAYLIAGIAEETGELCGKFAKAVRNGTLDADFTQNGNTTKVFTATAVKELGDEPWCCANLADCWGVRSPDVKVRNIAKLADRKERGKIIGEGDER